MELEVREFVIQGVQDTQVIQPAVTNFSNHCCVKGVSDSAARST